MTPGTKRPAEEAPAAAPGDAAAVAKRPRVGEGGGAEGGPSDGVPPAVDGLAALQQEYGPGSEQGAAVSGSGAAQAPGNGPAAVQQQQQQRQPPYAGRGPMSGRGQQQHSGRFAGRGWQQQHQQQQFGRGGWQQQRPQHGRTPLPARPPKPTLLQKLLAKDIRRDRSYLLQSFR